MTGARDEGCWPNGGGWWPPPLRSADDDCRMTWGRYRFRETRETIRSPPVAARRLRTRGEKNLLPLLVSDASPPFVHTSL